MGLFKGQFNKEGAGLPLPEGGFLRYISLLFSQFWKLLGANLLFVLFSLPVITLPAALCALNRVCILIYTRGSAYLWQDFWEEFRKSLFRSFSVGLLFAFLVFAGYYFMSLGLTNVQLPLWSLIFWALGITCSIAGICWGAYYFTLSAMLDLPVSPLLKNARLLCMLRPGSALLVFGLIFGTFLLCLALFPLSLYLLLALIPALLQYSVCAIVYSIAEEFIIEPYNEGSKTVDS